MGPIRFFIDFDGTITTRDVVDAILERFASAEWRAVEEEWAAGKIGSRECLSRQMALVQVSQSELKRLLKEIQVDKDFASFLKRAAEFSVPVAIVSDGFDFVIREVLAQHFKRSPALVENLPVFSNRLIWVNGRLQVAFSEGPACAHGCANCKPRVIDSLRASGDATVFVGDGLSDRFAAKVSDLTFAKGKLLKFCKEHKIRHKSYESFREIEEWLAGSLAIQNASYSLS